MLITLLAAAIVILRYSAVSTATGDAVEVEDNLLRRDTRVRIEQRDKLGQGYLRVLLRHRWQRPLQLLNPAGPLRFRRLGERRRMMRANLLIERVEVFSPF